MNPALAHILRYKRPSIISAPPTLVYVSGIQPIYLGNVATTTTANIGTAAADRLVVVVFQDIGGGSATSTCTVVINGITATTAAISSSNSSPVVGIASAIVPTGTTGITISATYNASGGSSGWFSIYNITGLSSATAVSGASNYDDSVTNTLSTGNFSTSAGGVVIAGCQQHSAASSSVTPTISNGTPNVDANGIVIDGFSYGAVFSSTGTTTSASVTASATWNASQKIAIAAAAWR
jgi:hypothetical protein